MTSLPKNSLQPAPQSQSNLPEGEDSRLVAKVLAAARAVTACLTSHRPLAILCLIALVPLFVDLGGEALWSDEGDTAVLALSVKQFGVPKAWDGRSFIDSDGGMRENSNFVVLSHPLVQYYVTAASFIIFGESSFAARFPFALAGWLTIIAVYRLTFRMTGDKRAGLSAAILLLASTQFLLYARQCRNYSLTMLLTCVLILEFLKLRDWKSTAWFALTGVLLFHTHPAGLVPLFVLGGLTLFYPPLRTQRKWFWLGAPLILSLTLPWVVLTINWAGTNIGRLTSLAVMPQRLVQYLIECGSVTPLAAATWLGFLIWLRSRKHQDLGKKATKRNTKRGNQATANETMGGKTAVWVPLNVGERIIVVTVVCLLIGYGILMAATHDSALIFSFGVRQVAAVIPLVAILTGTLIAKWSQSRRLVWLGIIALLGVTKAGTVSPWLFFCESGPFLDKTVYAAAHKPQNWKDRIFRTSMLGFTRDLWEKNPGTVEKICDFINVKARPEDILITNYDWEPLYFHTRRRLGLTIFPEYRICKSARRHSLPEYVFSIDQARWLIWRASWNGYQGYDGKRITELFKSRGVKVEKVAVIPETLWENRENVHFRRFPGNDRKFVWCTNLEPTEIYRLYWPKTAQAPERLKRSGKELAGANQP